MTDACYTIEKYKVEATGAIIHRFTGPGIPRTNPLELRLSDDERQAEYQAENISRRLASAFRAGRKSMAADFSRLLNEGSTF